MRLVWLRHLDELHVHPAGVQSIGAGLVRLISLTGLEAAALEYRVQEVGVLDQFSLGELQRAPPSIFLREGPQVPDPLEGRRQHPPVIIGLIVGHDGQVRELAEEGDELLALGLGPLHGAALSELLLGQAMGVDARLLDLAGWEEVLVVRLCDDAILEAGHRDLDGLVLGEAGRLGVEGVEVPPVRLLLCLHHLLRFLPLTDLLFLAHLVEAKALLVAAVPAE